MATTIAYSDLNSWLASQADNTVDTPYEIIITGLTDDNLNDAGTSGTLGNILKSNGTKYVSINEMQGTITTIGDMAFYFCSSLTSITIPDSVTTIGGRAFFYCSSLTSINIPNGVATIGDYTFYGCSSLTNITIPDSVVTIGSDAFDNCSSLTSITIPDSVTTIGDYAFQNCSSLTEITIPNSVTSIGRDAFYNCSSLVSVYISDIDIYCENYGNIPTANYGNVKLYLNNVLVTDVVLTKATKIGDMAFYGYTELKSITIGNCVTTIGSDAFAYCSSLTDVTIGNSVTTIDIAAFYGCTGLTSITIPDSVTTIGRYAFRNCTLNMYVNPSAWSFGYSPTYTNATKITFYDAATNNYVSDPTDLSAFLANLDANTPATPYEIELYSVTDTDLVGNYETAQNLQKILQDNATKYVDFISLNGTVTAIGDYCFYNCDSLVGTDIPDTVTSIGEAAFYDCENLKEITIPSSVTAINGTHLFSGCTSLTDVTFNNGEIKMTSTDSMFQDCAALTELNLTWLNTSEMTEATSYANMFINDTLTLYVAPSAIWTLDHTSPTFTNATAITWSIVELALDITEPLIDDQVRAGVIEKLEVGAIANYDAATMSYTWYKDGLLISGATTNTYNYVAVEDGTYKCEITATLGSDTTMKFTEATVTVVATPSGLKLAVIGDASVQDDLYVGGEIKGDFIDSLVARIVALENK